MFSHLLSFRAAKACIPALCIVSTSQAVNAQIEQRHERVRIADLDLSTQSGRDKLDRRIHSAASHVCSEWSNSSIIFRAGAVDWSCWKKAVADVADARSKAIDRAFASHSVENSPEIVFLPFMASSKAYAHSGVPPVGGL